MKSSSPVPTKLVPPRFDESLMREITQRQQHALKELYSRYGGLLFRERNFLPRRDIEA